MGIVPASRRECCQVTDWNEEHPQSQSGSTLVELREQWHSLPTDERTHAFAQLGRDEASDFFLTLKPADQAELVATMRPHRRRIWFRALPPDDLTDLIQELPPEDRDSILGEIDPAARREIVALMAYREDEAGGLMNPRFVHVRAEQRVEEAIAFMMRQARTRPETLRYVYVLAPNGRLLGVVSLRQLFTTDPAMHLVEIMRRDVITATETMEQGEIRQLFTTSGLMAIPVIDVEGRMKGVVTIDDIVDVVEEEATEDIHRLGGTEVLDAPYLKVKLRHMIRKRAGWLTVLFVGEMFTANAMAFFEKEIERAVVLALFIPLIISSGGNSGSQASTLVVRAIALKEVRLRDWWRVFMRELAVGSALGGILGVIGLIRVLVWPNAVIVYGAYYQRIAITVGLSLVGIVLWGSICGSMLPFLLRLARMDPATASAPFVATLVDVSGLILYFSLASWLLGGLLL